MAFWPKWPNRKRAMKNIYYPEASSLYRTLGWQVVVPSRLAPHSKLPAEGISQVFGRGNTATAQQMDDWAITYRDRGCLLKMPEGVIGIDKDDYWKRKPKGGWGVKTGDEQLTSHISRLGGLPSTHSSTSRGSNQPSGIYFFRLQEHAEMVQKLDKDIEIIQNHHRYAAVWPSVHPETGQTYQWYSPDGLRCTPPRPSEISLLPREWYDHLIAAPKRARASAGDTAPHSEMRRSYENDPIDWVESLDNGYSSIRMAAFYDEVALREDRHIGHDELLSLIGRLHYYQFTLKESGARGVFDLILATYLQTTNAENPTRELSDIVRWVAGEDFVPCQI